MKELPDWNTLHWKQVELASYEGFWLVRLPSGAVHNIGPQPKFSYGDTERRDHTGAITE